MSTPRPVVIYGAGGYTGRLVAEFLREYSIPFVAAGRNKAKLQEVMNSVPGIETADYEIAGDWFGRPVNVASRVTSAARPGSVLVAESTHDLVGSVAGLTWTPAGSRRLKGLRDEIKLFRLAR